MKARYFLFRSAAAIAALVLAGCAGSALPNQTAPRSASIARATVASPAVPTFTAFVAGKATGFPASAVAWDIAAGSGGTMWFTDPQTPAIGKVSGGKFSELRGLPSSARPYAIAGATDGSMWFTDAGTASAGRVNANGSISEFTTAALAGSMPQGIAAASEGSLWFVSVGPKSFVAHVTPKGAVTAVAVPKRLSPDGSIAVDPAGNVWFMAIAGGYGRLVERAAAGGFTVYDTHLFQAMEPCCPNLAPRRMIFGPDGDLWFTTLNYGSQKTTANLLGTFASGAVSLFRMPAQNVAGFPSGIAVGSDRRMWVTGSNPFQYSGGLWRISTSGTGAGYTIPYSPVAIAAGLPGQLWLTSNFGGTPSEIVEATFR